MPDALSPNVAATAKLTDVASINPRMREKPAPDTLVSFVPMAALSAETASVVAEEICSYAEVSKGYTPFQDGDVLVAKITPCFENNKIGQAKLTRAIGLGSTEFHVVRPRPGQADARYLMHFLRQDHVRREGERKMTGSAGQRRVPEHVLADLDVPLPSLTEQRRIAAILDGADALRAKRRATLARLDEVAQAIFVDVFGDPTTNIKGWPVREAREIGRVVTGNTPSRAVAENYGSAIEWIKSDNLGTSSYYATQADEHLSAAGMKLGRTAPAGTVLVTCIAGSPSVIGNTAMLDREAAFNQQINALIPTEINPHFAYAHLKVGKSLVQAESTASMKGMVSKSRFERIPFMVPPRPMQDDFADQVLCLLDLRGKALAAQAAAEALFASLQHRAFTGAL